MDAWAARLLRERPEVEEVVVFGSFAEGRWAPGSDLDVLLALSRCDKPIRDRVPDYLPGPFPVGVDVFPFTRVEIEERRSSPIIAAVTRSTWRYRRG
jgi:uncharacterized protein